MFLSTHTADHAFNFKHKNIYDSNMIYEMHCGGAPERAISGSDKFRMLDPGSRCQTTRMDSTTDCLVNPSNCEHGFTIAFWSKGELKHIFLSLFHKVEL